MSKWKHRAWVLEPNSRKAVLALTFAILVAVVTQPAQAQTYKVLYTFTGGADGSFPEAALTQDAAGNLYGTTIESGNFTCSSNCGNVFKLDPSGKETTLHTFKGGKDGSFPYVSGVVRDQAGNLYGTTEFGGKGVGSFGVVYKLSKTGRETILHNFATSSADGEAPQSGVILDSAGNVYGTTLQGDGLGCRGFGCGTIFKIDKAGKETRMSFNESLWGPATLVRDAAGNLYGTTYLSGGTGCGGFGCGTVFKVDKTGKRTLIYAFQGGSDGVIPNGNVVLDKAGNLYGTTWQGGNTTACPPSGCGTVYKIDKRGKETVLHRFAIADGLAPQGGLVLDSKGNLYGTTFGGGTGCGGDGCGTVYKIDKTGTETVLYSFTSLADGGFPYAGLVRDKAGNLYGTASSGGNTGALCIPNGCGVVFKLTP